MSRVANKDMAEYVIRKEYFVNNHGTCYGHWEGEKCPCGARYIVASYGRNYPLHVFCEDQGQWFTNSDRYSPTTMRHYDLTNPGNAQHVERKLLELLADFGYVEAMRRRIKYGTV